MVDSHDEWYTPWELYRELCNKYVIYPELDVAAIEGHAKCVNYFSKEDNALTKEWKEDSWMNPPLLGGLTKQFVLKAYEQWHVYNINILAIVPAGVISRQWFRPIWNDFLLSKNPFIDPIKRPTFLDHGEPVKNQARNDYIALVFRKR